MKESYEVPLISSVFEPLEKLRISGGYGSVRRQTKKRVKRETQESEEKKREESKEKESRIEITV